MKLADQTARDRIRSDLDTTLVVEAAAGTGKTTELVRRMLATLLSGAARLDEMVAVTFTEAAAGELKLRLRAAIEEARGRKETTPDERRRLTEALPLLEEARIGTIHAFCADLLRERPVEARVDPLFEVAAEEKAQSLFDRAFDRWFASELAEPEPGVARILRRQPGVKKKIPGRRNDGPRRQLRAAAWNLKEWRDFPAPWRRDDDFEREAWIDALVEEVAALGGRAAEGDPNDWFTRSLREIERFAAEVARREAVRGRDYDGLEANLVAFSRARHWRWHGYQSWKGKDELKAERAALQKRLADFAARSGADLAPLLREELRPVLERYEALKERAGCLDFLDLLLRVRDLVRTNRSIRTDLQRRFRRIFVDEFQDTDPLQAEVLLLLSADAPDETDWRNVRPLPGKLFVVGDPKQSIYRFRRADVALYGAVKQQILDSGGALVELGVSFRSVPEIQRAVNAAFEPRMAGRTPSEPSYVSLSPFRQDGPDRPAVVALPVPEPYAQLRRPVRWKIEESLPDAAAAFVDWLVHESGWTVTEPGRPDERVPVQPRHVCFLFRRVRSFFSDVTRPYVRALEARRLPHLLVGGTSFHVREEVEAIRNALQAIERPDDELSVFATLRGPLFALDDGLLLAFREEFRSFHPFRRVDDDPSPEFRDVAEALALLRELHVGRNRRPIADTIGRLLGATRAHAGFAIWPTGEQALANVTRLMDLARRFERNGGISFRSFVDWLADEAEHGEASDAPIIEEGTDGVRVMTVHKAKGLEFPVVILADLTANAVPGRPSRWTDTDRGLCALPLAGCVPAELAERESKEMDHEREEADRVLYVAATRARDVLVVPGVGERPEDGWLAAFHPVIYPPEDRRQQPETSNPPGCPELGRDTTIRPSNVMRPATSVSPGLHRPEAGIHRVVWWSPAVLRLGVREAVGLAQQKLLEVDERGDRSEAGISAHRLWQERREEVRKRGSVPRFRVVTATELSAQAVNGKAVPEISLESAANGVDRPHGRRFGTLLHAVLARVDLSAAEKDVAAVARLEGRILGAPDDEIRSAMVAAVRALSHPLLRRAAEAARSGRCRREVPLVLRQVDGTLVEGVADLAFRDDDGAGWTVVDFKSDFELDGRLEEYRRQVGVYVEAVAEATGEPARGVLLRV